MEVTCYNTNIIYSQARASRWEISPSDRARGTTTGVVVWAFYGSSSTWCGLVFTAIFQQLSVTYRYEGNEDFKMQHYLHHRRIWDSWSSRPVAESSSNISWGWELRSFLNYKDGTEKPGHWKHIQWYPPSLCGCVYVQTWKLRFGL